MNYAQQIKHPLWQKKRLEVLQLRGFQCQECGAKDEELHVHHPYYRKRAMIWEYEKEELECLCHKCHKEWHEIDDRIKEELSVCRLKGHALAYIMGLNASTSRPILTKAKESQKARQQKMMAAATEDLQPPPYDTEAANKSAEAFFAKMKELTSYEAQNG